MKSIVPKIETLLATSTAEHQTAPRAWPADLWRIGVILLLVCGTRLWVVRHTEVLSRDSIGFIRFALQIEQPADGLSRLDIIRNNSQPPGYPAALLAVSWPVRSYMGETTCDSMVLSAQLTSVLAALLLVFPMYFLGKTLFNRQTAFIATLLYQLMPVCTQVTSDGLSDGVFLLMAAMSLWMAVLGLRRNGIGWFAAAGLLAGLGYLVRPESVVLVLAVGVVILGLKLRGVWTWRPTLLRGGALVGGLLVAMTPYIAVIGKFSNKPTAGGILKGEDQPTWERNQSQVTPRGVSVPLAEWWNQEQGIFSSRAIWGVKAMMVEIVKAAFYVLPLFAFLGVFLARSRIRDDAAVVLLVVLCSLHAVLLWVVASRAGYVAERHTLLVVLFGSYFTGVAIPAIGGWLASAPRLGRVGNATFWTAAIVVAILAACIPGGMKTLHANRAGHHAAGLWIAQHREPNDFVKDPFAWAEFYSGYLRSPPQVSQSARVVFVVLEGLANNPHPRLHQMPEALRWARYGKLVYHWPVDVPAERGKVFVYRLDFNTPAELQSREMPLPLPDDLAAFCVDD